MFAPDLYSSLEPYSYGLDTMLRILGGYDRMLTDFSDLPMEVLAASPRHDWAARAAADFATQVFEATGALPDPAVLDSLPGSTTLAQAVQLCSRL